ncbi:MAG: rhomboid-like protein, partial [Mycobacterium sp.]
MLLNVLLRLARVRFTVTYAVTLVSIGTALLLVGPQARDQIIRQASTNLDNLRHGHLGTLLGSAFVTDIDTGPMYLWLPGLICLLALAELLWRSGRLATVFLTGHVGASLLVAAGLAGAVRLGWLPLSITFARDVGMSYGAAAVRGALTAAIPRRGRPAWIGWWLSVAVG